MKEIYKQILLMVSIVLIITFIILLVYHIKDEEQLIDKKDVYCIAENSQLVVSKTCSHCANQKIILGEYIDLFKLIEISENQTILEEYNINSVPTWIIHNKTYVGVKSLNELKNITGC